tara:strand:- start:330 stop:1067 length:738 start_codon:yes stop_codon:yes gene_type:complete
MKNILLLLSTCTLSLSQDSSQINQGIDNWYSLTSASFFNYGTTGYELDGFIEFQMKKGFFLESSINYEMGDDFAYQNDETISINSSIGIMKSISNNLYFAGGISNYTEKNDDLNELFFGMISKYLTGMIYIGIQGDLAPNFLGLLDINSFFKNNIPIDISIMNTYNSSSNDITIRKANTKEGGFDTFLRFTKDYETGMSIGYNFSQERYETPELFTYKKQGQIYQKNRLVTETGFFHTVHIGYLF